MVLLACNTTTTRPVDLAPTQEDDDRQATVAAAVEGTQTSAPSAAPANTAEGPQPTASPTLDPRINPLTGLEVADPAMLDRRPVSVKVNNYPRSNRPQWGLSLADIVFEYYHNNELPRFHAIFYVNDAEMVGPIRSGRPFDDYLLHMFGSHFVFGSADARILERFKAADYVDRLIYLLEGPCPPQPTCRFDPQGYNFLITDTQAARLFNLQTGGDDNRPNLSGMTFDTALPNGGMPLEVATLRYSYSAYLQWRFDPQSYRYVRYQDTQEDIGGRGEGYAVLTDRLTGKQIEADNVVFLVIPHFHLYYAPATDSSPKSEIVDMDFHGEGQAYVARDGRLYEVLWVRPAGTGVVHLKFPDGTPFPYKPGVTWYEVINDETIVRKEPEAVRFDFVFTPPDDRVDYVTPTPSSP